MTTAPAKAAVVELKWKSDKWEGPFCPRCNIQSKMRIRETSKGQSRPIFECYNETAITGCGYAAYCDEPSLKWKKKEVDFFALNKEFSTK
jgi:hypothetical protein